MRSGLVEYQHGCAGECSQGQLGLLHSLVHLFHTCCLHLLVLHHAQAAESELLRLSNRVRFIMAVINGTLKVSNRRKAEIEADLTAQGFDRMPNNSKGKVSWAWSGGVDRCGRLHGCHLSKG